MSIVALRMFSEEGILFYLEMKLHLGHYSFEFLDLLVLIIPSLDWKIVCQTSSQLQLSDQKRLDNEVFQHTAVGRV